MDSKELRELIELFSRSNVATFELEREGLKLKLVKGGNVAPGAGAAVAPSAVPASPSLQAERILAAEGATAPAAKVDSGIVEMTSPIVGTFYRAAGPEAAPFVQVGSHVKKGQVLCIVEAMKLMNEIESEIDAEVLEVLVDNGQPVEFGEVLFRLRPLS